MVSLGEVGWWEWGDEISFLFFSSYMCIGLDGEMMSESEERELRADDKHEGMLGR